MINQKILSQNIITELGLESLDDAKKIALLDKMSEIVEKRLTLRAVEEMKEEDRKEFEKILGGSPQDVADFLAKVFPNFLEMIQEEVTRLKEEMVKEFKS